MRNRMTLVAPAVAVMVIAASSLAVQPTRAQTTAKAQGKADECLSRPGATTPKGSHWYYRIDRPTNRRCWYLGPAGQKVVQQAAPAERAEPAERSAVPLPAPAPSELRPDEQPRAETPAAARTDAVSATTTAASSVTATQFSATWPHIPNGASSSDRDVPVAAANTANTAIDAAEDVATAQAQAQAEDLPLVWPVVDPADRAAAAPPLESAPGLGHLAIFLAATIAFVAIAFRALLKLSSAWFGRSKRRVELRPASPVIRPRAPERPAAEPTTEALTEPAIARLREIAQRWEQPTRVPRQPRIPAYGVELDYEVKAPPPRRRRVA